MPLVRVCVPLGRAAEGKGFVRSLSPLRCHVWNKVGDQKLTHCSLCGPVYAPLAITHVFGINSYCRLVQHLGVIGTLSVCYVTGHGYVLTPPLKGRCRNIDTRACVLNHSYSYYTTRKGPNVNSNLARLLTW